MEKVSAFLVSAAAKDAASILKELGVPASAADEFTLLNTLGEYANAAFGVKKSTARDFIYKNHSKEYYSIVEKVNPGIVTAGQNAGSESDEETIANYLAKLDIEVMSKKLGAPGNKDDLLYALAHFLNDNLFLKKSTCRRLLTEDSACNAQLQRWHDAFFGSPLATAASNGSGQAPAKRAAEFVEGSAAPKRQAKDFSAVPPPIDEPSTMIDTAMANLSAKFASQCKVEAEPDKEDAWNACRKTWAETEKKGHYWSPPATLGLGATRHTQKKAGPIQFVKAAETQKKDVQVKEEKLD